MYTHGERPPLKEVLADFGEWALNSAGNLTTLFVGTLLIGFSTVTTVNLVSRLIQNGVLDLGDALRVALILTAFVIGVRIAKESDYTTRLFSRY